MVVVEEILASIVADYNNISSLSGSELDNILSRIRHYLTMIISENLTNVEMLGKELEKTKGKVSQTEIILNFFHHLMSHFPSIIFAPSIAQFHPGSDQETVQAFGQCHDFLFWFCNSLFTLLAQDTLSDIHSLTLKLLITLTDLVKTKSINMLNMLLKELVKLHTELNAAHEHLNCSDGDCSIFPLILKSFVPSLTLEKSCLVIKDFTALKCLRLSSSVLLKNFISDIMEFSEDEVDSLWCVALFELEHGSISLKSISLDIITELLICLGMTRENIRHYFMFCVFTSLEISLTFLLEDKRPDYQAAARSSFLKSLNHLLEELFLVEKHFISEGSFHDKSFTKGKKSAFKYECKYDIDKNYLMAISQYFVNILSKVQCDCELSVDKISVIRYGFTVFKHFLVSHQSYEQSVQMRGIDVVIDICCWIMNSDCLQCTEMSKKGMELFSLCLSMELQGPNDKAKNNMGKDYQILHTWKSKFHELVRMLKMISDSTPSQKLLTKGMRCAKSLSGCLTISILTHQIILAKSISVATPADILTELTELVLERHVVKNVVLSLLQIMKKTTDLQGFIDFVMICIGIVQLYGIFPSFLYHSSLKSKIVHYQDENLFLFHCIAFLPWRELSELKDLFDTRDLQLEDNLLHSIYNGLIKNGFRFSKSDMNKASQALVCECIKTTAVLQSPKYKKVQFMILLDHTSSCILNVRNVAMSFLPYFLVNYPLHSLYLDSTLSVVENLIDNFKKTFTIEDFAPFCFFLLKVLLLSKGLCNIKAIESTKSCNHFPSIMGFSFELKYEQLNFSDQCKTPFKTVLRIGSILLDLHLIAVEENLLDHHENHCVKIVLKAIIEIIGEYLEMIRHRPLMDSSKDILKKWLKSLRFYSEQNLGSMVEKVIGFKNNNLDEYLDTFHEIFAWAYKEKDVHLMISFNKILGGILKLMVNETEYWSTGVKMFDWVILRLFIALSSTSSAVQSSSLLELSYLQLGDRVERYRSNLSLNLARILSCDHLLIGKRPLVDVIEDAASIFCLSSKEYLCQNMHTMLPLITSCHARKELLIMFAEITSIDVADLLLSNFKHIYCHVVITEHDQQDLFRFLENETRIKQKDSLILLNFGGLVHHLVSYLSVNMKRVHQAIDDILKIKESSSKKVKKYAGLTDLRTLLCPHFLGILTHFNCQLRSTLVFTEEKRNILESLTCMLKVMRSKDISTVRVKIINTLCLAQQLYKNLSWYEICCSAWSTFVRRVEPAYLGPLLSQIAATLLPMMAISPSQVTEILTYLVIEKNSRTQDHLHELHFLPSFPILEKIYSKVQDSIKCLDKDDLVGQLMRSVDLMANESSEVRYQALARLKNTLKDRQDDLQQRHVSTCQDSFDGVMSKLMSSLLLGSRDSNKAFRLLCGQCIGLVGAIDPDRLKLDIHRHVNSSEFLTVDQPTFAYFLIMELTKAFLAAKPTHQDISAFAIQELLKIYECREGEKDCQGRRLWRRFSENVQEVLKPHHTSRYLLKKNDIRTSNLKQPILFRKSDMTFMDWAGIFCSLLMQMVYQRDETSTAGRVFRACSAVVRNDVNIALFLLPHATLQALLTTNHTDFIVQEILAILSQTKELKEEGHLGFLDMSIDPRSTYLRSNCQDMINAQHARGSDLLQLSAQAVFSAFDHITRWLRQVESESSESKAYTSTNQEISINISKVKQFFEKIPQLLLAQSSFHFRAYRRALLHFESHLRNCHASSCDPVGYHLDKHAFNFLQRLFVEMNEPDGVAGVASIQSVRPILHNCHKQLESTGKLQDACACYAHTIQLNPDELHKIKDYIKCLLDLGQLSTATFIIEGIISKNNSWKDELSSYWVEAAWRMGRWDNLEEFLGISSSILKENAVMKTHNWNIRIGELLVAVKNRKWEHFESRIHDLFLDQTGPLLAATMESGSYQTGYKSILRLHMLAELEMFAGDLKNPCRRENVSSVAAQYFQLWQKRLQPLQNSFKPKEPILCLHRSLLDLLGYCQDITNSDKKSIKTFTGKLWLQTAKEAREAGYLQTSYNALMNAQEIELHEFCIEYSKWLWNKGESHQALLTLQKAVSDCYPDGEGDLTSISASAKMSKAKAMLLVARLMEESSSFDSGTVLKQFREVISFMPDWEDSHFYAAKYYDKLMTAFIGDSRFSGKASHLYYIMHHYGLSLCFGTSHIYESLTKLLTVWLDYETNIIKLEKAKKNANKDDAQKLIDEMIDLTGRIPAYVFLTAFSQLISRICHPHLATFKALKVVISKVIQAYPQQALWSQMAISKSSFPKRAQRCKEIFNHAEQTGQHLSKIIFDMTRLTEKLIELCNKPSTSHTLSMSTHFKSLKRLVEEENFSKILVPLQRFMTVTLPQGNSFVPLQCHPSTCQKKHDPFPEKAIHIIRFDDKVEVLNSLQKPKKVSIQASDGKFYVFLCKPKDDLRKDSRLMEFNTIVNKCLKLDSETRKRQLKIRTYAVVPLNEECGLIEWVPNTQGLRNILLKIYRSRNLYTSARFIKSLQLPQSASLKEKLDVFKNKLLPRHPPVLRDWFLTTFSDPTSWYRTRLAYARSTAVMSIVGYILGLGDRHGENILLDSVSGEVVHVDFNCLFNKGLTLDVPEVVPFRLTHNMTDAMGPTKHEGFYRRGCETVMQLLRQQKEPLLSVLRTFIHDPLVEWSKRSRGEHSMQTGEILNEKALSHISDIDRRLRGIATKSRGLPLSIEGHVHYIIQEAIDEEKLCQMYIGWAPFM